MLVVSALYPNCPGSRFDAGCYAGPHAAFARDLLGPYGLTGLRITIGIAAPDGTPPPFLAISELHFVDRAAFDAAMRAVGDRLMADADNYTDVAPMLQVSRLVD